MNPKNRIAFECIVASLDDAHAAYEGGADRFELCSALALGGLTPSLGLLRKIKKNFPTPVMAMVRPREGGMHYSEHEFQTMLEDARVLLGNGADGIVFGFLKEDGSLDLERCSRLMGIIQQAEKQSTFHRAFDVVVQPGEALKALADLGVTRVLTSGREPTALEGIDNIVRFMEMAEGRIEILPGGSIDVSNVREVVEKTKADQVHLYLTRIEQDASVIHNPKVYFGAHPPGSESEIRVKDREAVAEVRRILDSI